MLNVFISHVAVECNLEIIQNLESIGINSKKIEEDNAYIKAYLDSLIQLDTRENKNVAWLPWKQDTDELLTNITVTKKNTENVTTRLIKTPDMLKQYGHDI